MASDKSRWTEPEEGHDDEGSSSERGPVGGASGSAGASRMRESMYDESSVRTYLNDIGRVPLLTALQEIALARRIEQGDEAARRHMIEAELALGGVDRTAISRAGAELLRSGAGRQFRAHAGHAEVRDYHRGNKFSDLRHLVDTPNDLRRALAEKVSASVRLPVHVVERLVNQTDHPRVHTCDLGREPERLEVAAAIAITEDDDARPQVGVPAGRHPTISWARTPLPDPHPPGAITVEAPHHDRSSSPGSGCKGPGLSAEGSSSNSHGAPSGPAVFDQVGSYEDEEERLVWLEHFKAFELLVGVGVAAPYLAGCRGPARPRLQYQSHAVPRSVCPQQSICSDAGREVVVPWIGSSITWCPLAPSLPTAEPQMAPDDQEEHAPSTEAEIEGSSFFVGTGLQPRSTC